jgi:hypothetical protein
MSAGELWREVCSDRLPFFLQLCYTLSKSTLFLGDSRRFSAEIEAHWPLLLRSHGRALTKLVG